MSDSALPEFVQLMLDNPSIYQSLLNQQIRKLEEEDVYSKPKEIKNESDDRPA